MNRLVDKIGQSVPLGRELGRGGEGAVYEVVGQPDLVAKLYHDVPDAKKQDKLIRMAAVLDDRLHQYAAWPEATLHQPSDSAVVGFTMQRIKARKAVHMLYSPGQRRSAFPNTDFGFLVYVARNIAAAFDTVHDHGHVLGDVNQGNVLVGADSQVILIDCDSFQVCFGDIVHRCEVGVAHFTPPELQHSGGFEQVLRTSNHDCFGLAILIFHLLMGGRHPFSGVPQSEHVGETLESNIREFRYAYARDANLRLLLPPPRSVPIDVLPLSIQDLFEQAFLEPSVNARPTAAAWVAALDRLRAGLKTCSQRALHRYPGQLESCCWCALNSQRIVLFGNQTILKTAPAPRVTLWSEQQIGALRAEVLRIQFPDPISVVLPRLPYVSEIGPNHNAVTAVSVCAALVLAALLIVLVDWPADRESRNLLILMTMGGSAILGVLGASVAIISTERRRKQMLQALEFDYFEVEAKLEVALKRMNLELGVHTLRIRTDQLMALIDEYELLRRDGPEASRSDAQEAIHQAQSLYLQKTSLNQCQDPRVQARHKLVLREAQIDNADQLSPARLQCLDELEAAVVDALLAWKGGMIVAFHQTIPNRSDRETALRARHEQSLLRLQAQIESAHADVNHLHSKLRPISNAQRQQLELLLAKGGEIHRLYSLQASSGRR